jgi:hypothetical protein
MGMGGGGGGGGNLFCMGTSGISTVVIHPSTVPVRGGRVQLKFQLYPYSTDSLPLSPAPPPPTRIALRYTEFLGLPIRLSDIQIRILSLIVNTAYDKCTG